MNSSKSISTKTTASAAQFPLQGPQVSVGVVYFFIIISMFVIYKQARSEQSTFFFFFPSPKTWIPATSAQPFGWSRELPSSLERWGAIHCLKIEDLIKCLFSEHILFFDDSSKYLGTALIKAAGSTFRCKNQCCSANSSTLRVLLHERCLVQTFPQTSPNSQTLVRPK